MVKIRFLKPPLDALRVVVIFCSRVIAGFLQLNEFGSNLGTSDWAVSLRKSEGRRGRCRRDNLGGDKEFVHDYLEL